MYRSRLFSFKIKQFGINFFEMIFEKVELDKKDNEKNVIDLKLYLMLHVFADIKKLI
jgi:hypothetical protein